MRQYRDILLLGCSVLLGPGFFGPPGRALPWPPTAAIQEAAPQVAKRSPRTSAAVARRAAIEKIQQLIQRGDLVGAQNELAEALRSYPTDGDLHDLMGVVHANQRNYREAESGFRKAIQFAPGHLGAYLNLGHLYQENAAKDPQALSKALATYRRLLKIQPDNAEANYQAAFLLLQEKSYQTSLDHLSRLPPEAQERPQALALRCADLAGLGKLAEAEAMAAPLVASPELAEADILQILPTLEAQHSEGLALRLLEKVGERGLASPATLAHLGKLYTQQGKFDQARESLEKAAAAQPTSVELLIELARVAEKQQDHKGALGYLAHARDLEPENAGIHFFFGIVCVEENLVQEAYVSLKKAVSLKPENPYYNYAFGAVAVDREDPREAVPAFQKYCALKPYEPRGRLALGIAQFKSGDSEAARRNLEEAARNRETASSAHFYLAKLANQEGKFPEALHELEAAVEITPRYANAHAEKGVLLMKQKEYAQAEQSFLRALEIDPDNYTANFNLMILYQRTKDARAEAQTKRFDEVKKKQSEEALKSLRSIEVRPYAEP